VLELTFEDGVWQLPPGEALDAAGDVHPSAMAADGR